MTERFHELFQPDWRELNEQWQVFIADLEYGDDVTRTAIDFTPGARLPADGATVQVAADRGWQNSGLRLEAGTRVSPDRHGPFPSGPDDAALVV